MTPTITTGVNLQVVKIEAHLDVDVKVVPGFKLCFECQVTGSHEPIIEYNRVTEMAHLELCSASPHL